jgi:hypothetical protein
MNRSLSLTSFFLFPSVRGMSPSHHGVFPHPPRSSSLWTSLFHHGPISEIPQSEKNIYKTPSLRKLSLVQPQGDCLQFPLNWASLTDLTIEGNLWNSAVRLSLHQAMDLLSRCPRLIHCRLEIRTAEVTPTQFSLLTLPHLESLSIFETTDVTNMFDCLNFPVSHYHTDTAFDSTKRPWLLALLGRLGGSIQRFTTDPQHFTREDFIECLRLVPQATILNFKFQCSQQERLRALSQWINSFFIPFSHRAVTFALS